MLFNSNTTKRVRCRRSSRNRISWWNRLRRLLVNRKWSIWHLISKPFWSQNTWPHQMLMQSKLLLNFKCSSRPHSNHKPIIQTTTTYLALSNSLYHHLYLTKCTNIICNSRNSKPIIGTNYLSNNVMNLPRTPKIIIFPILLISILLLLHKLSTRQLLSLTTSFHNNNSSIKDSLWHQMAPINL